MAIQPAGLMEGQNPEFRAIVNLEYVKNEADRRLEEANQKITNTLKQALRLSETNNGLLSRQKITLESEIRALKIENNDLKKSAEEALKAKEDVKILKEQNEALLDQIKKLQKTLAVQSPVMKELNELMSLNGYYKSFLLANTRNAVEYLLQLTFADSKVGFKWKDLYEAFDRMKKEDL